MLLTQKLIREVFKINLRIQISHSMLAKFLLFMLAACLVLQPLAITGYTSDEPTELETQSNGGEPIVSAQTDDGGAGPDMNQQTLEESQLFESEELLTESGQNSDEATPESNGNEVSNEADSQEPVVVDPEDEQELDLVQVVEGDEAVPDEIVEISDAEALYALAERVNAGDGMENVLVLLADDISLDSQRPWIPIGSSLQTPFRGTFDGQDHVISGITVEDGVEGGLFGYLYEAVVQNLYLKNVMANNSVNGLYFSAVRTDIINCSKKWGIFSLFSTGISLLANIESTWTGGRNTALDVSVNPIRIQSADDLAQIAYLNNTSPYNTFQNKTLILEVDIDLAGLTWSPIGTGTNAAFQGHFYGSGSTIRNMKVTSVGGLFNQLSDGSVSNLIIANANVTCSGSTGILAATCRSSISSIVVMDSHIQATNAAGIVYSQTYGSDSRTITQCVVMDTDITATSSASGIVCTNANYAVTQCAVYRGSIKGSNASGITYSSSGPAGTYSGINQNVVLGTVFSGTTDGIVSSISSWNSTGNVFVSDVTIPAGNSNYLGTRGTPYGVDYYFTDSRLTNPLISSTLNNYITDSFWDRSTVSGTRTGHTNLNGKNGHGFYTTSYLTGGAWKPNEIFWEAKKDYYPFLKYTMNSSTPYMREITGLTSVAVLLDNPEETLDGAKEFRLVNETAAGDMITWTATSSSNTPISLTDPQSVIKTKSAGSSRILYTQENDDVVNFNLQATITLEDGRQFYKNFKGLTLKDSFLDEEVDARFPTQAVSPILISDMPSLTFNDRVGVNTTARGMIRLFAQRNDGSFTLEKALPNNAANVTVTEIGGKYVVEFPTLNLAENNVYRLSIPLGALVELDSASNPKDNLSEEILLEFYTELFDVPYIEADHNRNILTSTPLTLADVQSWFTVTGVTGANNLLSEAVTDSRTTMAGLGAGIHYYVDPAIIGDSRQAGASIVHVFAVTEKGLRTHRAITVDISGLPEWETAPTELLHTYWTNDAGTVQSLVTNDAKAYYATSRGGNRLASIEAVIDSADWAAVLANPEEPATLLVTSYMLDINGSRMEDDARETIVYLDKALKYTFNTGALRYKGDPERSFEEWKELIEQDIAFMALNFADTANVSYRHDTNNYAEDGTYYIYLETDEQQVTLCDGSEPCLHENHKDLKTHVSLKFTVKIYDSGDPLEREFWRKVGDDVLQSEFNNAVVRRPRLSYVNEAEGIEYTDNYFEMPAEIVEMLRLQPYNTLELHYSAYNWKFYGHAMTAIPQGQKLYPLKARQDEEMSLVRRTIIGDAPAVQLSFDYVGHLHGRVEFSYDLRLAGGLSEEEIADTNFYLYRYSRTSGKLIPVSDVIVNEDGWASVVLTQIDNSPYIFTDAKFGGEAYRHYIGYGADQRTWSDENEPYYQSVNNLTNDLSMFNVDNDVEEQNLDALYDSEQTNDAAVSVNMTSAESSFEAEDSHTTGSRIAVAATAGILTAAALAFVFIKLKKGKGA